MSSSTPGTAQTPVRVALAGFGAWGLMHAKAIEAIEGAHVVAILARSDSTRRSALQAVPNARLFDSYDAMLRDGEIDVVNIVLPNHLHAQAAVEALEASKHVFLEKPLGLDLSQCDAVIAAAERSGRLVAVNHELRVSKQWGLVREIVDRGDLGTVRHQHLSLFRKPFRTGSGGWRYDPARVGSWVLEELVHFIDLILWYAQRNGHPGRVTAFGSGRRGDLSEHFTVVLEWADGATAVLNQCLGGFEHHTVLELSGSAGALRTWWSGTMDRTLTPSFELKLRRGEADVQTLAVPLSGEVFELEENLRQAYRGFAAGRSVMPAETARLSIAVSLAAERSFAQGRGVDLAA